MQVDTVVVPVDGTERAMEAAEYAVAIADRYDAVVHACYLLGENAALAIAEGHLEAATIAEREAEVMAGIRSIAGDVPIDHSSAFGFSPHRLSRHPGSVILDVVEALEADFVVVPRSPQPAESGAVLEKAAEYVIGHASQPVLSV